MQVKTVRASSVKEAMEQIKDELGSDAVLLHTKKYREGGMLGGAEMIEVTAAVDETQSRVPRSAAAYTPPPAPILPTNAAERYRMNEEAFAGGTVGVAPAAVPQGYDTYAPAYQSRESMYAADGYGTAAAMNLQSPAAAAPVQQTAPLQPQSVEQSAPPSYTQHVSSPATQPEPIAEPHAEHEEDDASAARIRLLEDELAQMKTMLAAMMAASQPKEIVSIRDALKRQDVRKELREELAAKVPVADINLDSLSPRAKEVLAGYLSQVMKFTDGLRLGAHGSRVVAFIGTTGVGKTTTLAKVAAHFVLEQNLKGALITADTYRISAVEQLKKYAEILGLPVEVVYSAADLKKAIARHRSKDFILVDTAGRSQYNDFQMDELKQLLAAHPRMEKHLVVSATTKEQDAAEIMARFSACKPDRIIFTKTDETRSVGVVLNLLAGKELPLSFLSNGQSVPDDIIPATAQRLAELLLRE
ncbi:flagellar biosynthesis protein FlhF [Selenomonas sp. oral taxon 137 str. F0430]|uniref:flagellar biosynthesis protein FlhF n=1 Tax=Selenomonas sp. oral taxon 137 TaxID=712531 RepID=UPI0001EB2061|nr:flagellar biosynthesis protein FlhF [Selenomonas sp. oral taxon 137]EFR40798.1 flagellar biosynthesis protein FlhF [Selenomonas sp. oral taxon 137 str. F0430]